MTSLGHEFARRLTDRRSAAGRAPDALRNDKERDARPVRCNGWLCPRRESPGILLEYRQFAINNLAHGRFRNVALVEGLAFALDDHSPLAQVVAFKFAAVQLP